jgi:hypothetical protein
MTDEEIIEGCGFGYCETVFTGHYFVEQLPDIGDVERLYIRTTDNTLHRFDADLGWVAIGGGGSVYWDDINNKPTAFPPSAHGHFADGVTITGTGTTADPFVAVGGGVTKEQESLIEVYKFQNYGLNF